MNILLTGDKGFIGKHARKQLQQKYKIIGFDRKDGLLIQDKGALNKIIKGKKIDIVINMASETGVREGEKDFGKYIYTNIFATENLVRVCEENNIKQLIHFSSSSALNPISIYGITKLAGEKLIERSNLDWTIIRPFTVIGENGRTEMVIYKWLYQYKKGKKITFYGDGTSSRGYTAIYDLLNGLEKCILNKKAYKQIFDLGGNKEITLERMWGIFQKVFKHAERKKLKMPKCDIKRSVANTKKAEKLLKWKQQYDVERLIEALWRNN